MILYSPASYFLCIIVVQIIKEPIFLWDICGMDKKNRCQVDFLPLYAILI